MEQKLIFDRFKPYMSKTNAEKLSKHIIDYCNIYAEENNAFFLLDDILTTKVEYLETLFKKNDYLKNGIRKKNIKADNLCNLLEHEIDPEKFKHQH